jgi:hypothetical protein
VGLLIDSTVLIEAERHQLTPEELIAEILERWGDVELAMSAMGVDQTGRFLGLQGARG